MPILKREPEIYPPDLFGGQTGESDGTAGGGSAAGLGRFGSPGHVVAHASGRGTGHGPTHGHGHGHSIRYGHNGNGRPASNGRAQGSGAVLAKGADSPIRIGLANGDGCAHGHAQGHAHGHLEPPALTWWVAHVRSRQEKNLGRHLLDQQVPYYLPQREHRHRHRLGWRSSFLPLFPGYLFLRGTPQQRVVALRSNLIVQLLGVDDETLLEQELRTLWRLQCSGIPLVPHPYIGVGDSVEVVDGCFKGYRGVVIREKGSYRLVVSITLLRQSVAAEVDRELLAPDRYAPQAAPPGRWRHHPSVAARAGAGA